jgi:hypothetical protein
VAQFDVLCVSLPEVTEIDHENSEAFSLLLFTLILYSLLFQLCNFLNIYSNW